MLRVVRCAQLHAAVVELTAGKNAEIKYSTVQNWYSGNEEGKGGIYNFVTKRGLCHGDNSKISWTQVWDIIPPALYDQAELCHFKASLERFGIFSGLCPMLGPLLGYRPAVPSPHSVRNVPPRPMDAVRSFRDMSEAH